MSRRVFAFAIGTFISMAGTATAATFSCPGGDSPCLITSIGLANAIPGPHTINLAPGIYTLAFVNNTSVDGPNGLPVVTGRIAIVGNAASTTVIRRSPFAPPFRLFEVARAGTLTIDGVTLQDGALLAASFGGAAILNQGVTGLSKVIVRNHFHANLNAGGALRNLGKLVLFDVLVESNVGRAIVTGGFSSNNVFANGSLLAISLSTLRNNRGETGAAILTLGGGPSFVVSSTVTDNQADVGSVGAAVFAESGEIRFVNTTIARNLATGVVTTGGSLRFVGCTIADNAAPVGTDGGGILNLGGLTDVLIQNTILARNTVVSGGNAVPRDCAGNVGSNGNNLVGTFAGCSIILRPIDKLGDPGLGVLTDQRPSASGAAFGLGHLPLLAGSQAIDAGEPAACSPNDQLGFPRADGDLNGSPTCDIGAIEFEPIVNTLVTLPKGETVLARRKGDAYKGGTATLMAQYRNTSAQSILRPVFVVRAISDGALLVNGDPPSPGGVGARLTPNVGGNRIWLPGQTITVRFVMGLQEARIPTFRVDLFGYPQ